MSATYNEDVLNNDYRYLILCKYIQDVKNIHIILNYGEKHKNYLDYDQYYHYIDSRQRLRKKIKELFKFNLIY